MSTTSVQSYRGSYVMPSLEHATVADAMHPGILSCEPDASVIEVARMMATQHVHCLVVIGVSHDDPVCGVWGIVSDLDVVRAGIRYTHEPTARELAQQPVVTVQPSTPLREAAEEMLARGVSHVVVLQAETQKPVGVLSSADVIGAIAWGEV